MLDSVLTSETAGAMTPGGFLICICSALALGLILTLVYRACARPTKSFSVTLATLPGIVSVIIMMVSGSLGAGVAVAGTFSLVRFRSAAGSAREIGAVFTAMAIGLSCGMGYPLFGLLFTLILCAVYLLYAKTSFGENRDALRRTLNITVPEDLEYNTMFDSLMDKYTAKHALAKIKTTNLGSLNRLTYDVTMKAADAEKAFIDELRCLNGNLEISMAQRLTDVSEL